MEQNYGTMLSSALLTEHQGVLIKVRSSHSVDSNSDYKQAINTIVEDLKKHTRLVKSQ